MKVIIFLTLAALISAQRNQDSSFLITNINQGVKRAPNFYRVEVEFTRFDDAKGILSSGKPCDTFSRFCDPRIRVQLDTESPLAPFPGAVPVSKWKEIINLRNTNSFNIGKAVTHDVCGGAVNRVNARALVEDIDGASRNDEIGKFDCKFDVFPQEIARDSSNTQWGPITECVPEKQQGKIRLFARQRAYAISSTACHAM